MQLQIAEHSVHFDRIEKRLDRIEGFNAVRTITVAEREIAPGVEQAAVACLNEQLRATVDAIRVAACGWFTTVLGPGSDAAHAEHMHVDILQHGSSDRYRILSDPPRPLMTSPRRGFFSTGFQSYQFLIVLPAILDNFSWNFSPKLQAL